MKVYMMKLPISMTDEQWHFWMSLVTDDRKNKIGKLKRKRDKMRSLLSEIVLLNGLTHYGVQELTYEYNAYKKPYLINSPVYFNMSHSGDYVLCGISDEEIGVDVEMTKDIDLSCGKLVFCKNELQMMMDSKDSKKTFYGLWTKKESLIKAIGKGFFMKVQAIDLSSKNYMNWRTKSFEYDDCIVSLCTRDDEFPKTIDLLDYKTLWENKGVFQQWTK